MNPLAFFPDHFSLRCPHNLNAWNRLPPKDSSKDIFAFRHLPRFSGFNGPGLLQTPKILVRYHLHFNRLAPLSFHLTITAITATKSTLSPEVVTIPVQPPM